jgi:hypothetical protein
MNVSIPIESLREVALIPVGCSRECDIHGVNVYILQIPGKYLGYFYLKSVI